MCKVDVENKRPKDRTKRSVRSDLSSTSEVLNDAFTYLNAARSKF